MALEVSPTPFTPKDGEVNKNAIEIIQIIFTQFVTRKTLHRIFEGCPWNPRVHR